MRIFITSIVIVLFLILAGAVQTQPEPPTVGTEGISRYESAAAAYFGVPQQEVSFIHQSGITHEEIPVVLFLAQHGHVTPSAIVDLNRRGMSWQAVTRHLGLDASIYHVDVSRAPGPPYDNAMHTFTEAPETRWKFLALQDPDIINLVNLKFLTGHCHADPDRVMTIRGRGKSFIATHYEVHQ